MGKATLALLLLAGLVVCLTVETSKAENARKSLSDAVDDETSADLALSRETGEAKQRRQNKSRKSKVVKRRRRNDKFGRKQQKRNKKNKKVQKGKKNKLTRQQADTSSITTTDTCVEDLARLAGVFGNQARNVYRQAGRVESFAWKKESRRAKKNDFMAQADILLSAVGGNSSCSSNPIANSQAEFDLGVLQNCSTQLKDLCPKTNETLLNEVYDCKRDAGYFRDLFIQLFVGSKKTAAQICTRTKHIDILALESAVRGCVFLVREADDAQYKEHWWCNESFRSCRNKERNFRNHVDNCRTTRPTSNTMPPVPTNSSSTSAPVTGSAAQSTT